MRRERTSVRGGCRKNHIVQPRAQPGREDCRSFRKNDIITYRSKRPRLRCIPQARLLWRRAVSGLQRKRRNEAYRRAEKLTTVQTAQSPKGDAGANDAQGLKENGGKKFGRVTRSGKTPKWQKGKIVRIRAAGKGTIQSNKKKRLKRAASLMFGDYSLPASFL